MDASSGRFQPNGTTFNSKIILIVTHHLLPTIVRHLRKIEISKTCPIVLKDSGAE
jgi:hypothetical protein